MASGFFPRLLHLSSFRSPLLRAIVPSVTAAIAIQAAVGGPSVAFQSERFYDFSGSITFLAVGALSLYLPALRARALAAAADASASGTAGAAASAAKGALPSLLAPFRSVTAAGGAGTVAGWNWRQVVLTGMTAVWAIRLGSYLLSRVLAEGKDSRFDEIKKSPPKFAGAFFAQAVWVSLCMMPIILMNGIPSMAFAAIPRIAITDIIGLSVWLGGFTLEVVADRQKSQWLHEKRTKQHDEEFLTKGLFGRSRYPNYFGEMTLWTGIAIAAAGILARKPVQLALGLSGGPAGILATTTLSFVSPAFASFILLKVSGVPLSEKKYGKRYGDRKDYQEWKKNTNLLVPKLG